MPLFHLTKCYDRISCVCKGPRIRFGAVWCVLANAMILLIFSTKKQIIKTLPAIIHIHTYGPDKINSIACQWQWKKTSFPQRIFRWCHGGLISIIQCPPMETKPEHQVLVDRQAASNSIMRTTGSSAEMAVLCCEAGCLASSWWQLPRPQNPFLCSVDPVLCMDAQFETWSRPHYVNM